MRLLQAERLIHCELDIEPAIDSLTKPMGGGLKNIVFRLKVEEYNLPIVLPIDSASLTPFCTN